MRLPIDESSWPLVVVRWSGAIDDAMLHAFLVQMDVWLERGERFALLIDARGARGLSPEQRTRLITHMKRQAASTSRLLIQASVLDSLLQRTLFYGVQLIFPHPFPSKGFGDAEAARRWLMTMLGTARSGSD